MSDKRRVYLMLSRVLLPASLFVANTVHPARCMDIQDFVNSNRKTCFPAGYENDLKRAASKTRRRWVLEVNPWASHRVVTTIAAILLKEYVGYEVFLNSVSTAAGVYDRAAKLITSSDGSVVNQLKSESFGYINMEVWPAGKEDAYQKMVVHKSQVLEYGSVGYHGHSGWFVAESFTQNPKFPMTPELWRAYDISATHSGPVIAALRQEYLVSCSTSCCCHSDELCCASANDCKRPDDSSELQWCPTSSGHMPAILAYKPEIDPGFNEEIVQSNGFRFAVRYLGASYRQQAGDALSSGAAQIVWSWYPSIFLEVMHGNATPFVRIMLPSHRRDCGIHLPNAGGNWSCDFPSQTLSKIGSIEVGRDPVVKMFLRRFSIPEGRSGSDTLAGGGIQELLRSLMDHADPMRPDGAEQIFDAACAWILSNQRTVSGWVPSRKVPGFADTVLPEYPFPTLLTAVSIALAFIFICEVPWLRSTLDPWMHNKIMSTRQDLRSKMEKRTSLLHQKSRNLGSQTDQRNLQYVILEPGHRGAAENAEVEALQTASAQSTHHQNMEYETKIPHERVCAPHEFWSRVEAWHSEMARGTAPLATSKPLFSDIVHFAHHTFPAFENEGKVPIMLQRSEAGTNSGKSIIVEVVVEESSGGAAAKIDFEAGTHKVEFPVGSDHALIHVPVYDNAVWQNPRSFQVRLSKVLEGEGCLATPAVANVRLLDDDMYPTHYSHDQGGLAIIWYYIRDGRIRRGAKWGKTMYGLLYPPFHFGFVSVIVQKMLVDFCAKNIVKADKDEEVTSIWMMCCLVVASQFVSTGLARWADATQTRNRGRTGGFRQDHRQNIFRKFLHLDHSENWDFSVNQWLYCSLVDVEVIVMNVYWPVFIFVQNVFAFLLSLVLVIGLLIWSNMKKDARSHIGYSVDFADTQLLWYLGAFVFIVPLELVGIHFRKKVIWATVVARGKGEQKCFGLIAWLLSQKNNLFGLTDMERDAISNRWDSANKSFVKEHQVARDVMGDNQWIIRWAQDLCYSLMLLFGIFAYIDYERFGLGSMEIGTFYALCKIYLNVGRYVGRAGKVLIQFEKGIVSLRKMSALLSLRHQKSFRVPAKDWAKRLVEQLRQEADEIIFHDNACFVRPSHSRHGATFADLRLSTGFALPIGSIVFVSSLHEGSLCSLLGLAAQVIHTTDQKGDNVEEEDPRVVVPHGLAVMMLPPVPVSIEKITDTILEELQLTGASTKLCEALLECMGLESSEDTAFLSPGHGQVVAILKALLTDPDVLCVFRPLALIPQDLQLKIAMLMRLWQAGGGAPRLAEFLDIPFSDEGVYRSNKRTLVIGNCDKDKWKRFPLDLHINLDDHLRCTTGASENNHKVDL